MSIYIPARSPEDWRHFLADPVKHWVPKYSAKELAYAWHRKPGFPAEVARILQASGLPILQSAELLIAIPEHQVSLPPATGRPSQTDLFALAGTSDGLLSIAIEGKVAESFGPLVSEWFVDPSAGKKERLGFLCDLLRLPQDRIGTLRYQLLHRTASALIEARRFHARHAMVLIHSFSAEKLWFEDYSAFMLALGSKEIEDGRATLVTTLGNISLYCGWASGLPSAP